MKETVRGLDVLAIGEMLVDMIVHRDGDSWRLEAKAGGAPANVAVCLRRLGLVSGYCGMLSTDFWGEWLLSLLREEGVNDRYVVRCDHPTTLAMVRLGDGGEREFSFYRHQTADILLEPHHVSEAALTGTRAIHVCSVSMSKSPAREATLSAIERAKACGTFVSFDVNWRPMLWDDQDEARDLVTLTLPSSDFVKMSEEEMLWLFPGCKESDLLQHPARSGDSIWIITRGSRSAVVLYREEALWIDGFRVDAVDTTGAGDAFSGAFLAQLAEMDFAVKDRDALVKAVRFAHAAAAVCVTRYGAIPAMPRREEVEQFASSRG